MPSDCAWFSPVCDSVLKKICIWYTNYHRGDPSASRPWVNVDGAVVERVTRFANRVRFKPSELDHLIRIMDALAPTRELVEYFRTIRKGLRRGTLLPGGEYEVILNANKQDVEETMTTMIRAKTGKQTTVADLVEERAAQGQDIWG